MPFSHASSRPATLQGLAINRENSGPKSGGRLVVASLLKHEVDNLAGYSAVLHNGDVTYACGEGWLYEADFILRFAHFPCVLLGSSARSR